MKTIVVTIALLLAAASSMAKAELSERLTNFANVFESKIAGKFVAGEVADLVIAKGKGTTDRSLISVYHGLEKSSTGLRFKRTLVIFQTNYALKDDGTRGEKVEIGTRFITQECEIRDRSGVLLGICRNLSNSSYDPIGYGQVIKKIVIKKDEVVIVKEDATWQGKFDVGKEDTITATAVETTFSWNKTNKLVETTEYTSYDIDSKTKERTVHVPEGGETNPTTFIMIEREMGYEAIKFQ